MILLPDRDEHRSRARIRRPPGPSVDGDNQPGAIDIATHPSGPGQQRDVEERREFGTDLSGLAVGRPRSREDHVVTDQRERGPEGPRRGQGIRAGEPRVREEQRPVRAEDDRVAQRGARAQWTHREDRDLLALLPELERDPQCTLVERIQEQLGPLAHHRSALRVVSKVIQRGNDLHEHREIHDGDRTPRRDAGG